MNLPLLKAGSLSIGSPPMPARPSTGFESDVKAPAQVEKPYLSRLVLLVPAEVISLYVAFKTAAVNFLPWFGLVCLALVILVRIKATSQEGKPEWGAVFISTVSFGLWVYSTGGTLPGIPAPADPGIISVAIGVWTFVTPYFYQGKSAPDSD
jgi:hypothetical protein